MIGSGIFASPGSVLAHAGSVGGALAAWVVAGLLSMLGAATYAELGTCIPRSGGEYAFIHECYGALPAFLFAWTSNLVIKPGGTAIIVLVAGQYIAQPFYSAAAPDWVAKGAAYAVLVLLTAVNCLNVHLAAACQRWLTYTKLVAIALVAVVGVVYLARAGAVEQTNFSHVFANTSLRRVAVCATDVWQRHRRGSLGWR